jgi:hypothetical protein
MQPEGGGKPYNRRWLTQADSRHRMIGTLHECTQLLPPRPTSLERASFDCYRDQVRQRAGDTQQCLPLALVQHLSTGAIRGIGRRGR